MTAVDYEQVYRDGAANEYRRLGLGLHNLDERMKELVAAGIAAVVAAAKADVWDECRRQTMSDYRPPLSGFDQRDNPYRTPGGTDK